MEMLKAPDVIREEQAPEDIPAIANITTSEEATGPYVNVWYPHMNRPNVLTQYRVKRPTRAVMRELQGELVGKDDKPELPIVVKGHEAVKFDTTGRMTPGFYNLTGTATDGVIFDINSSPSFDVQINTSVGLNAILPVEVIDSLVWEATGSLTMTGFSASGISIMLFFNAVKDQPGKCALTQINVHLPYGDGPVEAHTGLKYGKRTKMQEIVLPFSVRGFRRAMDDFSVGIGRRGQSERKKERKKMEYEKLYPIAEQNLVNALNAADAAGALITPPKIDTSQLKTYLTNIRKARKQLTKILKSYKYYLPDKYDSIARQAQDLKNRAGRDEGTLLANIKARSLKVRELTTDVPKEPPKAPGTTRERAAPTDAQIKADAQKKIEELQKTQEAQAKKQEEQEKKLEEIEKKQEEPAETAKPPKPSFM